MNGATDPYTECILVDRNIASIKQAVQIAPKEDAIPGRILSAVAEGYYVCGLQHRQCALVTGQPSP